MAAARARLAEAEARARSVRAQRRPQVGLEARAWQLASTPGFVMPPLALGPITSPSLGVAVAERRVQRIGIGLDQLLWDGGRSLYQLRAARRLEQAAILQEEATRLAVRWQVVQAAGAWQRALAERNVAEVSVAQRQALVEQVDAFVRHAQAPKADLLQAQAARAMARHRLSAAEAELTHARAALEALTGKLLAPGAYPVWPSLPELPSGDPQRLAEMASVRRPLPRALRAQASGSALGVEAARRARRPSLHLQLRAERHDDALQLHPNNAEVALLARWSLLTGGRIAAEAGQARARQALLVAEAEKARRRVIVEARSALAADTAASEQLTAATAAHEAAEEALRVARSRYREGLISGRELLDAQQDATQARQLFEVARSGRLAQRLAVRLALGLSPLASSPDASYPAPVAAGQPPSPQEETR